MSSKKFQMIEVVISGQYDIIPFFKETSDDSHVYKEFKAVNEEVSMSKQY